MRNRFRFDQNTHIILIGFKHVGKSVIGEQLAKRINKPFIDLDQQIESSFHQKFHEKCSPRQIMETHGEPFFRDLETQVLLETLQLKSSLIALGGGTPVNEANQSRIKRHCLIHIKAPMEAVFQRIMNGGKPAFFSSDQDPYTSFCQLWAKREKIYQELSHFSVNNNGSVDEAVLNILSQLSKFEESP